MKRLAILFLALTMFSCSKDDDSQNEVVTIEYKIENGVSDGEVSVNLQGQTKTERVDIGPNFKLLREVKPDEWYYLGYVTKTPVPDNFKMYVKIDGKVDQTISTSSANWGYTYTITR